MIKYGLEYDDWKGAEIAAQEMVGEAQGKRDTALAHYQFAVVLVSESLHKHKDELFTRAHDELGKALAASANFPDAIFIGGKPLAELHQDDVAKAQFTKYLTLRDAVDPNHQRALRCGNNPDLARAKMAPAFSVTTLDGPHISVDDLQGKVLLLDFWATWWEPCREALPHLRDVAKKFQGQPLVVVSVSLDDNAQRWKDFVAKNGMT
jgi:thiol-disulfide isomerase/thioredoxin